MLLSVLSKATGVSLLLAMLCLDFLYYRRLDRRLVLEKLPFIALGLVFGVIALLAQQHSGFVTISRPLDERLLGVAYSLGLILTKVVAPIGLSAIYPWPDPASPTPLLALGGLIVAMGVALYSLRYTRKVAFATVFFFATIAVVLPWSGSLKFVAADRNTYIPLLGVFYVVGEGFRWLLDRSRGVLERSGRISPVAPTAVVVGALVVLLAGLTIVRVGVWQNSYALMDNVLAQYPYSVDARINRALASTDKAQAITDYAITLAIDPSRAVAYNNRGVLYYKLGQYALAKHDYDEGIRRNPSYPNLYFNRMLYFLNYAKDNASDQADLLVAESLGMRIDPELRARVVGPATTP